VVVAELSDGRHRGRGECVPYARYGETPEAVAAAIIAMAAQIARGLDRAALQAAMPPGAPAMRSIAHSGISPPSRAALPCTRSPACRCRNRS
jgi:L-alanine-DL-glutamate epimerase-like enolase superfamily enzyme